MKIEPSPTNHSNRVARSLVCGLCASLLFTVSASFLFGAGGRSSGGDPANLRNQTAQVGVALANLGDSTATGSSRLLSP